MPTLAPRESGRGMFRLLVEPLKVLISYLFSPEDFAILEAEYLQNERPDKAARIEIVQRVDMTEKEVQVHSPIERGRARLAAHTDILSFPDLVSESSTDDTSKEPDVAAERGDEYNKKFESGKRVFEQRGWSWISRRRDVADRESE
jgi:hypothetical protein